MGRRANAKVAVRFQGDLARRSLLGGAIARTDRGYSSPRCSSIVFEEGLLGRVIVDYLLPKLFILEYREAVSSPAVGLALFSVTD